jgi:hypothetical protein
MLAALCAGAFACGKKEEGPSAPTGPIVSVLDLSLSLRSRATAPSDAHEVELASSALAVGGQQVLTLTDGQFAPADRSGDELPKLKEALSKTPHANMSFAVGSALPYSSAALVLQTAKAAGVKSVSFRVRAPGATSNTGFLTLDNFSLRPKSKNDEEVAIPGVAARPWSDFSSKWEAVQSACRASPTGNCAYKPEQIADGGNLKIVLYAAGQGANIAFYRVGAPPPEAAPVAPEPAKKGKKAKSKGKKNEKTVDPVADVEQAAPATEAGFQFRTQEAVVPASAISESMRPVCGASPCAAVVRGEKATLFVRLLALIGAAFPDGTPAPVIAFELP